MWANAVVNHLGNARYQFLAIRFMVDGQGQLQHGVVLDLNEQQVGHFRQLEVLLGLVTHWLTAQKQNGHCWNSPLDE